MAKTIKYTQKTILSTPVKSSQGGSPQPYVKANDQTPKVISTNIKVGK